MMTLDFQAYNKNLTSNYFCYFVEIQKILVVESSNFSVLRGIIIYYTHNDIFKIFKFVLRNLYHE